MEINNKVKFREVFNITVIVAALGYFVDVYDLLIFLVIGDKSLQSLGVPEASRLKEFQFLLDLQMIGMLLGGVFWGILGDKKGRLSVLFGSIILYSLANIANGMVVHIAGFTGIEAMTWYAILRFIAGVGLAGELGAGITLVSEIMSKENRGYGTMVVASIGVTGAVVAAIVGKFEWELAYYIGGGLGLSLLLLRIGVFESGVFKQLEAKKVKQGDFFYIFSKGERAFRYLNSILLGIAVWFVIGILVARAPQIAKVLEVNGLIERGNCIMFCYTGLIFGDLASGALSQYLRSRKKVFFTFYILCIALIALYLNMHGVSSEVFYAMIFALGFSVGFWAVYVTLASEQFGTNMRATVTTTVPNFVRGSLVPVAMAFDFFKEQYGIIQAGYIVAIIVFALSFFALYNTKETFGRDLDFVE